MKRRNILIGVGILAVLFLWMNFTKPKRIEQASQSSSPAVQARALYQQAQKLKNDRKLTEAKQVYQTILSEYSDIDNVEDIQRELETLNMNIIFSNVQAPQAVFHKVVAGDTLGKLAKKYGTTVDLIKKSNNLKNDVIRLGQQLRVWTGKFNIFVDKSQNILILKSNDELIKVYNISTGENNSTPIGTFKVTSKLVDPVWFNRGVVVPPESPENVLGSRWLGFDIPGYGIHGTIDPETIGQQITAGCVRMRNEEVEELYSLIPMGTMVVIVD